MQKRWLLALVCVTLSSLIACGGGSSLTTSASAPAITLPVGTSSNSTTAGTGATGNTSPSGTGTSGTGTTTASGTGTTSGTGSSTGTTTGSTGTTSTGSTGTTSTGSAGTGTTSTGSTSTGTTSTGSTGTGTTGTGSTSTGTTSTGSTGTASTGSTTSSLLPAIPSTATVFDAIQNTTTAWSDCSDCAGGAVTSSYSTTPFLATPSLSGSSRQFFIGGPAWASALWIHKFGAQNAASHFLWDFYVYFDVASAAGVWSAEYDFWQSVGGQEHMMGTQCVFGTNEWDVWDSANNKWVNTGVACPRFSGDSWHHIQWDVQRISATQYRFNTLFVDDQPFPINRAFDANATSWSDDMGVQWQLDQNGSGATLSEWVDRVKLTIW